MMGEGRFEGGDKETFSFAGATYDAIRLRSYAERFPVKEVAVASLREQVAPIHQYWLDTEGNRLGPAELLADWQAAQGNPRWVKHVDGVKSADLAIPIWLAPSGEVLDGIHRLARAVLEGKEYIAARSFDEVPSWAIVEEAPEERAHE